MNQTLFKINLRRLGFPFQARQLKPTKKIKYLKKFTSLRFFVEFTLKINII